MSQHVVNILCLEDSPADVILIREKLTSIGMKVNLDQVSTEEEFTSKLGSVSYDLILSEYSLPGFSGLRALYLAKKTCPDVPFVCVSGTIGEDVAVEMMQFGAADYILKDRLHKLPISVQRVLREMDDRHGRTEAEKLARESETRFHDVVMSMYDMVWETDLDWKISYSSENVQQILGYLPEEILGKSILDFIVQDEKKPAMTLISQINNSTGVIREIETWTLHKDGHRVCLLTNGLPILSETGSFTGFRGIHKDITRSKMLTLELMKAKERAEAGDRLKTAFMNNISHEVRTPLNGILGFTGLLLEPDLTEEEKRQYQMLIRLSSNRLIDTINSYMDISMIVTGNMAVKLKPTDLYPLLEEIFNKFQPYSAEKNVAMRLNLPEVNDGFTILTDGDLLQKILEHLLDNAVKFTHKGEIVFGFAVRADNLDFFVKDTGIGVSKDAQTRIFENFMQEEISDTRGYQGSGLGLSIATGLVRLLGGETRMESEKGAGSTFSFTIPYKTPTGEAPLVTGSKPIAATEMKKVVLVAEDDDSNLFLLESILGKSGISMISAFNGQEAIDCCRSHPEISLVLMDMKMPVMDGMEATRVIKSFRADLPIVAITAFAMSGDEKMILEAGCDKYLPKPVQKDKLISILKSYGII